MKRVNDLISLGEDVPATPHGVVELVQTCLAARADPAKAPEMAAYMKTSMPFYGVQKPERVPIIREIKRGFVPATRKQYEQAVLGLWKLRHREEKYIALAVAGMYRQFIDTGSMKLYERLIREGAWWDFVDEIAARLVGISLLKDRATLEPVMKAWIDDDDMWIRRTAILCQLKHKDQTNHRMLFAFCRKRAHETEFFIRKAIGWALREYSRVAPDRVCDFLLEERANLSGLSFREGARLLQKQGLLS